MIVHESWYVNVKLLSWGVLQSAPSCLRLYWLHHNNSLCWKHTQEWERRWCAER